MTIITLLVVHNEEFDKYKIDLLSKNKVASDIKIYFNDLNFDTNEEEIEYQKSFNSCAINIKLDGKYLSVYNSPANETPISSSLAFADLNKNKIVEIYFLTVRDSIILLNALEYDEKRDKFRNRKYFIDSCAYFHGQIDNYNSKIIITSKNNVIFSMSSGFSCKNRNLYSFNFDNKTLSKTKRNSINYGGFDTLLFDNKLYYISNGNFATYNTLPLKDSVIFSTSTNPDTVEMFKMLSNKFFQYGDFASYSLVLNEKLNFAFPPIEHLGWTKLTSSNYIFNENTPYIVSLISSQRDSSFTPNIEIADFSGKIINQLKLKNNEIATYAHNFFIDHSNNTITLINYNNNTLFEYNFNLKLIKKTTFDNLQVFIGFENDKIFTIENNFLCMYDKNFKNKAKFLISYCSSNNENLQLQFLNNNNPLIYFKIGTNKYIFNYHKNKLYPYRYLYYIIIFIVWFAFIQFVQKINSKRLIKENEKLDELVKERTNELKEQNQELVQQAEELQRANENLNSKNIVIEQQHLIANVQHKEITDSINYASRIQEALLPSKAFFKQLFGDFFIFYKPKQIVSGDFYYLKNVSGMTILAVADCTGHGVPGAFLSLLSISFLNEIIRKKEITTAAHVLEDLREGIKTSLHQNGSFGETNDGLDIALCVIEKERKNLQYAGAFNPLFIIRNKEFIELKATRNPIGIYHNEENFKNHTLPLQNNDKLYLFSDGYADQIGGKNNTRFFKRRFKSLLIDISPLSMQEQKQKIEQNFVNWKKDNEQIDDVLVVGVECEI